MLVAITALIAFVVVLYLTTSSRSQELDVLVLEALETLLQLFLRLLTI